jgi:hypothetical protein
MRGKEVYFARAFELPYMGLASDAGAFLNREHEMILDPLAMIETAKRPRSAGNGVAKGVTSRMGVHFRREELLIAALQRLLGRKQERQEQFQSFSFISFSKGGQEHG